MDAFPAKDPSAQAAWIAARRMHAYRTAWRILGHDADAEDAAQEALVRAVKKPAALAAARDPERYLRAMAVKAALELLRRRRSRRARERRNAMTRNASHEDDRAERNDERAAVREALATLPGELRTPLVLRYAEEMTLEEIGAALGCSAPTARDRIQRGEARLRGLLARTGAAALAFGELVSGMEVPAPSADFLDRTARRLESVRAGAGAAAGLKTALLLPAAAVLVAGGVFFWATSGSGEPNGARVVAERGDEPPAAGDGGQPSHGATADTADPAPPARVATERRGVIEGVVVTEDGTPVAGARAAASSAVHDGKRARHRAEARTDAAGRFRLHVPVEGDVDAYALAVTHEHHGSYYANGLAVAPGRPTSLPGSPGAPIRVALKRLAAAGSFELAGLVLDPGGEPVARAVVQLYRGAETRNALPETHGLTDAEGRVRLAGRSVGRKTLVIEGACAPFRETLDLADRARVDRVWVVSRGARIAGFLRDLDGEPIAGTVALERLDASEGRTYEELGADGAFAFDGLDPAGRYEVSGPHLGWIAAAGPRQRYSYVRRTVRPGATDLDFAVKAWDDELDRGDHEAELHGDLVDVDGTVLAIGRGAVGVLRLTPDAMRERLPAILYPLESAQVMVEADYGKPVANRFHVTGLPPGEYVLYIERAGRNLELVTRPDGARVPGWVVSEPIRLAAGQIRRDLHLRVDRGAPVRGVAVDAAGAPVAGAYVAFAGAGEDADAAIARIDQHLARTKGRGTQSLMALARTDAQGRFHVPDAVRGVQLRVVSFHPDHACAVAELVPGEDVALLHTPR